MFWAAGDCASSYRGGVRLESYNGHRSEPNWWQKIIMGCGKGIMSAKLVYGRQYEVKMQIGRS